MKHFNSGLIFTKDNCVGCNRCVSKCGILGSNVSVLNEGKLQIKVDDRNCISCGRCLSECSHSARDYSDDSVEFMSNLSAGKKYSVILDASFFSKYSDSYEIIIKKLRTIGVDKVYDASYGGEISLWAHTKYLKEHRNDPEEKRKFISQTCPAVVNAIERYYPKLVWRLIPVQSPMICTAIYARNYLKDENDFVFLGPCIAAKKEIENVKRTYGIVKYNLTYNNFLPLLDKTDVAESVSGNLDLETSKSGRLFDIPGNFAHFISFFFPRREIVESYNGLNEKNIEKLNRIIEPDSITPLMIEFNSCSHGCVEGPGLKNQKDEYTKLYNSHIRLKNQLCQEDDINASYEEIWNNFSKRFENLNLQDFIRKFNDRYLQHYKIPSYTYEEIYNAMLKYTPESRMINCGSCGFDTCREMAEAIAYGYNRKENCIRYMNDEMTKRYYTDSLTGGPNRRAFVKKLKQMLPENPDKSYIICVGDINRLKIINDLYGIEAADAVLKHVNNKLKSIAGETGAYSRYSGGHFSLAIEYTAENMAILRGFKQFDCSSDGVKIPVTMRVGMYITQSPDESIPYILHCAAISMDKTVSLMENTYTVFTEEFRQRISLEGEITARMQSALDNDEFKIRFQPQYKTATGELVGAETLCTWRTGDGQIISPSIFIPIAEKNGYIRLIDRLIWRKAFICMRKWLDENLNPVPISINISRVNLANDALIYEFKHLDSEFNIPKDLIHFEITESAYMGGESSIVERINKIRDMGYQIAMDDFGSGYSSLNTLKDIPLDILKLDMGFLRSGTNMDKGGTIISSIVRMAQSLELITIAEGVETKEQSDFLQSVGCDIIQGFYYSRNITEEKYHELLVNNLSRGQVQKPKILGKIDYNNFYNPDSTESMMFENYTGPAAIVEFDAEDKSVQLIRCNQKCLKMFGIETYSFTEIRKLLASYMKSDRKSVIQEAFLKAVQSENEFTFISQNTNYLNKTPVWIKSHISQISHNGSKHVIYMLMNDVTDEKLTESTLEISNSQMALIMDDKTIGVMLIYFSVDLKRVLETVKIRILKVNDVMTDLTGYSTDEIMKWTEKETLGAIHPMDRPGFIAKFVGALAMHFNRPFSYEYKSKNRSGEYTRIKAMVTGMKKINKDYMIVINFTNAD